MLSRTVPTKTWCSWVTSATSVRSTSSGSATSSTPPTVTEPVRGPLIPDSSRPSVDLPEPLGPTIASRSPASRSSVDPVQHVVALAVGEPQVPTDQLRPVRPLVAGLPVLRHLGDAQQPGGRGDADLQPVHVADQPVQRLDQRLDVQQSPR